MDRDLAEKLITSLKSIKTSLSNINTNLFGARITTQPIDTEGAIDDTVTFSIVAENVESYQWYYKTSPESVVWRTSTAPAYTSATLTVEVSSADIYQYRYRCAVTGMAGNEIYSDVVKVLEPQENG